MGFKSYREESKINWGMNLGEKESIPSDKIQLGAFLRIADSMEKIANRLERLETNAELYERLWQEEKEERLSAQRSNAALRGHVTRLQEKLKEKTDLSAPQPDKPKG